VPATTGSSAALPEPGAAQNPRHDAGGATRRPGRPHIGRRVRWLSIASLGHTIALVAVPVLATRTGLPGVGCAVIALVMGVVVDTAITTYAGRVYGRRTG
jgi:hypothetical protein